MEEQISPPSGKEIKWLHVWNKVLMFVQWQNKWEPTFIPVNVQAVQAFHELVTEQTPSDERHNK